MSHAEVTELVTAFPDAEADRIDAEFHRLTGAGTFVFITAKGASA